MPDLLENYGVRESDPRLRDWIAGGVSGINYEIVNPNANWSVYYPTFESQKKGIFDTMACVSFSCNNSIETQLNRKIALNLITPEQLAFLKNNGYIDDSNKVNLSDRWLAKKSGTTPQGNYVYSVADAFRLFGAVPEVMWAWDKDFDWNGYYEEPPTYLEALGAEFIKHFSIAYEWIGTVANPASLETINYHLHQAPLQILVPVCSPWNTSQTVSRCVQRPQHAVLIGSVSKTIEILDHYEPYIKHLALDYYIPYVFKITLIGSSNQPTMSKEAQDFAKRYEKSSTLVFAQPSGRIAWWYNKTLREAKTTDRATLMSLLYQCRRDGAPSVSDEIFNELPNVPF